MGEQQDGGGDESHGIGEVFPWMQETGCIRFQRGAQLRDEVQAHCQQSQEQDPGHAQRPQEQAAFVGRVFKGAPSARQHAQDEEAYRLPEAAAEQEELPFARLALRQVPQGRLAPAAVGIQEFPRGARSRGARMEPAGGVGPPVRQPGMVQQVHKYDRLNQAQVLPFTYCMKKKYLIFLVLSFCLFSSCSNTQDVDFLKSQSGLCTPKLTGPNTIH